MADMTVQTTEVQLLGSLSSNQTSSDDKPMTLFYIIWVYVLPVALLVGIIGNILSIIVLQSKSFRHTTTGVCLLYTSDAADE